MNAKLIIYCKEKIQNYESLKQLCLLMNIEIILLNEQMTQNKVKEPTFGVEKKKQKRPLSEYTPEQLKKLKDKKRRRRRLQKPANYDPNRHMDPERWIKFKNRASQKRKGKKNQKKKR